MQAEDQGNQSQVQEGADPNLRVWGGEHLRAGDQPGLIPRGAGQRAVHGPQCKEDLDSPKIPGLEIANPSLHKRTASKMPLLPISNALALRLVPQECPILPSQSEYTARGPSPGLGAAAIELEPRGLPQIADHDRAEFFQ